MFKRVLLLAVLLILLGCTKLARGPLAALGNNTFNPDTYVNDSKAVEIGKKADKSQFQHKGFGKILVAKAEEIALGHGMNKMLVISGVGVREYYRKLGYQRDGPYMAKILR